MAEVISAVNAANVPVIAADIPTGVNPDTGAVSGVAVRGTMTLAFGFAKVGDVVYPGAGHAGKLEVAPLGIPRSLAAHVRLAVTGSDEVASMLPRRLADSNKGTYGRVLVVGGSRDYPSAPGLTSIAALRAGAGLAEAAVLPLSQQVIAAHALEPIYLLMPEEDGHVAAGSSANLAPGLGGADCLVAGPGLGRSAEAVSLIHDILAFPRDIFSGPMLIDADGLNALSRLDDWWEGRHDLVLTPHPGEMARLTRLTIDQVQADRIGVARTYAARWNAVVVLKGAGTVVARPDGQARINPTGGPNLATGGTGDVLSGIVGGLLAQGTDRWAATVAGTYLHGLAGDRLAQRHGDSGTLAGDLLSEIPLARRALLDRGDDS